MSRLQKQSESRVKSGSTNHRRLSPEARERAIVDGAIRFFAEYGFEATTRHLARELGITQPLLYRYFPSKEVLVEHVYNEVFMQRWNPEWEYLIRNRDRPLEDRLISFYRAYSGAIYDFVWVRIFIYSGLKGMDLNSRYLTIIRDKVLKPICRELRHELDLPGEDRLRLSEAEIELAWGLHGAFFYRAVRRYVYAMPKLVDDQLAIAEDVHIFLSGCRERYRHLMERPES
jgi:AcrR family transcriptional regulator